MVNDAIVLTSKQLAETIKQTLTTEVQSYCAKGYRPPALAVIRVGADPASIVYVNHKIKGCEACGITSLIHILPESTTEAELLTLIDTLNAEKTVDGILVQLPLPKYINTHSVIERILPTKDVDGFHPYNLGRLAQGNPAMRPCTPYGIMQLLEHYQFNLKGINAVIVGASNIVGRPMALELLLAGATVTICHRSTRNLSDHIQSAELVICATGSYNVIQSQWLNKNQIVIDVGMHRNTEGKIHGDLDSTSAQKTAGWLTPVPGGVGPMTICALLQNTLSAYQKSILISI